MALGAILYAAVLVAFWFVAQHFSVEARIGGHIFSGFASFALLLAPYWFFGFGAAELLQKSLRSREARVLALIVIGAPVEFRLLAGSFPHPGLSALPKFLLVDAGLYAFLVVRRLEDVGYDFRARLRDIAVGIREWAFYAPIAIGLGLALGFIAFHHVMPGAGSIISALLVTFFFVAIPEEFFFRGLLQNMLEARFGRLRALMVAAVIFGLSHFNKPLPFNWRYVLLASIAGIFYGRAWRSRRRVVASGITHTLVDVVWGLWFRVPLR